MSRDATYRALEEAAEKGLNLPERDEAREADARKQGDRAQNIGLIGVGLHSTDEEIEDWVKRLWYDQDDVVEERAREWVQSIYYAANYQYITYHRDLRRWIPRRTVPWRVRSIYNVVHRAISWRVSRLTENRPIVSVQARSEDRDDLERAEFKERLFWSLWEKLKIHRRLRHARRWAAMTSKAFLKAGWDATAGPCEPATKFFRETVTVPVPPEQTDGLMAAIGVEEEQEQELTLDVEYYVDSEGTKLTKVWEVEEDEEGETKRVRQEPPEEVALLYEGDPYVDVRTPFNIRWERHVDELSESWWIQDADIMPASRIISLWPDAEDKLMEATPADAEDKALQWHGIVPRRWQFEYEGTEYGRMRTETRDGENQTAEVEKEYMVLETWVFPRIEHARKLWGDEGRVIVWIGGKLVGHYPLPIWARKKCPFIEVPEDYEPGNHYGRSFIRDVIPLQDDINRSRSHMAEAVMAASRPLFGAVQNSQMNLRILGKMPGVWMEWKSPVHKPEMLHFNPPIEAAHTFYESSLAAALDLANMNEASTGKLPSAGLAAKAIYALQFADERSITEVSEAQDDTLRELAELLDQITRHEYSEARKIRVVGENREYLAEADIDPTHLDTDVDYRFVPGSMLSRQKEAVKNEIMTWLEAGLIDPETAARMLPSAVPGGLNRSNDLHEAKARRQVAALLNGDSIEEATDAQPWDNAPVHIRVITDTMVDAKWRYVPEDRRQAIIQLWQAYTEMMAPPPQPMGEPGVEGQPGPVQPVGEPNPGEEFPVPEGAQVMDQQAAEAMGPPEGFGEEPPLTM